MSKATMSFTLPEENEEFTRARNGQSYHSVIWDLDQWLRGQIKYGNTLPGRLESGHFDGLQEARDKLWQIIADNGVSDDFS